MSLALAPWAAAGAQAPVDAEAAVPDAVEEAPALTEEERSARARALFAEGVQHTQAEEWEPAALAFEAALEMRTAPAIRYNLAAAYVELGRYREAQRELDLVAADPETPETIATLSGELTARLRGLAGRLLVERPPELVDAAVAVDDEPVDPEQLHRELLVAPGAHVVTATRDGREVARAEVSVASGERTHVVLGARLEVEVPGPELPPPTPEPTPFYADWPFWVGVGSAVVVLTVVIVAVAVAVSSAEAAPVVGNFMPGVITW